MGRIIFWGEMRTKKPALEWCGFLRLWVCGFYCGTGGGPMTVGLAALSLVMCSLYSIQAGVGGWPQPRRRWFSRYK